MDFAYLAQKSEKSQNVALGAREGILFFITLEIHPLCIFEESTGQSFDFWPLMIPEPPGVSRSLEELL